MRVSVCLYEQEVTGSYVTRVKNLPFSASLDSHLGRYNRQPTDMTGYGPSHD